MHGFIPPTRRSQDDESALFQSQEQDTSASDLGSQERVSDEDLIQMIAHKRAEMGETMTDKEKQTMKEYMDSVKEERSEPLENGVELNEEDLDEAELEDEGDAVNYEGQDAESDAVFAEMEKSMPGSKTDGDVEAESSQNVDEATDAIKPETSREEPPSATLEPENMPESEEKESGGKKE